MPGKNTRLRISSAGTTATPLVELEFQGDLQTTTGKTIERSTFKNGSVTAHGAGGWSAQLTIGERTPMPTAQALLWTHHNAETPVYIEVSGLAGSVRYTGVVKVAITEDNAPVSGVRTFTVQLSEDGVVTQGIAT